jgi:outer membrane protein assembly factor BamE
MIDQSNDSEERGQMQNLIKTVTLSLALSLTSGCSYFSVYKRDLPQGNLVTPELVGQLERGMSREQVKNVMGAPLLESPFDANEWDYVFRLDKAYAGVRQRRATLTFASDRLIGIETFGDMRTDIELSPDIDPGPGVEPAGAEPLPDISPAPDPGEEPSISGEEI